ncbi:pyridoxamine 5'-phosphate oxidase family protein [Aestuariivirga litoralis]|uniref:pyridoxamine 5'-phosphate oxidase family protein n=1 Tax=Aestuariivirga litoralis TaxID=2650924 RepID=UPI0018C818D6|nr:pyridoxamine 5'-phosphate oxidase family protein [Aestuariivirga litoralis]MBG1230969.1 pyridoxamine 5'-phosphate oxidase family protein [Aestuariivirga litoralis]
MEPINSLAELEALYQPLPTLASTAKEASFVTPHYRKLIEASPFVAIATAGLGGLDCSPRGDAGAVVRVIDEHTLALPDRRGNNRIDSLRNILIDPRVALLFLLPGSGTTFRVNGTAMLTADTDLCASFEMEGKRPRTVMVIKVEACYFQCARAVIRAGLWDEMKHIPKDALPTAGEILDELTQHGIDAKAYDDEWPGRAAKTMW